MRLPLSSLTLCAAALLVVGCPKGSEPGSAVDAGAAGVDAGPPPVALHLQYELADAGGLAPLALGPAGEPRPVIPPTSMLELRSTLPLRNYRVRLFDESDRAMVSDDLAEESSQGLVYRISLPESLKAGHRYTLVIDAQTGDSMSDSLGRELDDVRIAFQIAGDRLQR